MTQYIITFLESNQRINGSVACDRNYQEIFQINDEQCVKEALVQSFLLATNILNSPRKIEEVNFQIENYEGMGCWVGKGLLEEDQLKISELKLI